MKQNNLPLLRRRSYPTPAKTESKVKTTKNQDLPVIDERELSTEKEPGTYYTICNLFKEKQSASKRIGTPITR